MSTATNITSATPSPGLGGLSALASLSSIAEIALPSPKSVKKTASATAMDVEKVHSATPTNTHIGVRSTANNRSSTKSPDSTASKTGSTRKRRLTEKARQAREQKAARESEAGTRYKVTTTRSGRTVKRSKKSGEAAAAAAISAATSGSPSPSDDSSTEDEVQMSKTQQAAATKRERDTIAALFSGLGNARTEGQGKHGNERNIRGKRGRWESKDVNRRDIWAEAEGFRQTLSIDTSRVQRRDQNMIGNRSVRVEKPSRITRETLASLQSALSRPKFRSFCHAEHFVSALDTLYFAQNEFLECLYEQGMGGITKLARKEWSYVRSTLGRPRRMSKAFLAEEVKKLEQYRADVRNIQQGKTILCAEDSTPFPEEVPARLTEGQTVVARHPNTCQLHTGVVMAGPPRSVGRGKVAVPPKVNQGRPAMGGVGKFANCYWIKFDHPGMGGVADTMRIEDTSVMAYGDIHSSHSMLHHPIGARFPHAGGDVHLLAKLLRLLDRKEALITHLRSMNDLVERLKKDHTKTLSVTPTSIVSVASTSEAVASAGGPKPAISMEIDESTSTITIPKSQLSSPGGLPPRAPARTASTSINGSQKTGNMLSVPLTFREQYAWVIVQLEQTSKWLDQTLQALRMRQSGISLTGTEDDKGQLSVHMSHMCYQRAREMMESLRSKMITSGTLTAKTAQNPTVGGTPKRDAEELSPINNLIVCCMSLVLLIQFCAERGLAPIGIDSVLKSLKPQTSGGRSIAGDFVNTIAGAATNNGGSSSSSGDSGSENQNMKLYERIETSIKHLQSILSAV